MGVCNIWRTLWLLLSTHIHTPLIPAKPVGGYPLIVIAIIVEIEFVSRQFEDDDSAEKYE